MMESQVFYILAVNLFGDDAYPVKEMLIATFNEKKEVIDEGIISRDDVADQIRKGKTFQTALFLGRNKEQKDLLSWKTFPVSLYHDKYLTVAGKETDMDDLGELPFIDDGRGFSTVGHLRSHGALMIEQP